MNPTVNPLQRIGRLAPYGEILARIAAFPPVAVRDTDVAAAVGWTLAEDVAAPGALPDTATALRDGWAVAAETVTDAGSYTPAPLAGPPVWVETGQAMPRNTDAVLPPDAIDVTAAGAEASVSAGPGEMVLPAGAEISAAAVLRRAGEPMRAVDAAAIGCAGIGRVRVRGPRIGVFSATVPTRGRGDTISPWLVRAIEAEGAVAQLAQASSLEAALADPNCDAVITIGGTGAGRRDVSVSTLARVGRLFMHGFGISPGETGALGAAASRPVLMLPGRLDAALAAFLLIGRPLLAQLAGRSSFAPMLTVTLARKVTSTVGLAEAVPVRLTDDGAEPLASGQFPLGMLVRAGGWIFVPPESEGFASGTTVQMRTFA